MNKICWIGRLTRTHGWVCFLFIIGVSVGGCNRGKPAPEEVALVAMPGDQLTALERALDQEQGYRRNLLAQLQPRAELVAAVRAGDPASIDADGEVLAQLLRQLQERLRSEEAKLLPLKEAVSVAEAAVDEADSALKKAVRADDEMSGTVGAARTSRRCGADGCGGSCGDCDWDEVCFQYYCRCISDCGSRECGKDSCGGVCGTGHCPGGEYCSQSGACEYIPTEEQCRRECRSIPEGPRVWKKSVKDFGSGPNRNYDPGTFDTLASVGDYLSILKTRAEEMDALITGSEALATQMEELSVRLATAKSDLDSAILEQKSLKDELRAAVKAAKKAQPDQSEAAALVVAGLEGKVAANAAHVDTLKTRVREFSATQKELEASIRKRQKDLPDIRAGRGKLGPEIERVVASVGAWQSLKNEVSAARSVLSAKRALADAAREALKIGDTAVREKQKAIEEEMAPALRAAEAKLAELRKLAITDVVGMQPQDGLNAESVWMLAIRDETRLAQCLSEVARLVDTRKAVFASLAEDRKKSYPAWPVEIALLQDYLRLLTALQESTARQLALQERLVACRQSLIEPPAPEDETAAQ